MLSGGSDGTLRLWNAANGEELRRFEAREGKVLSCAFSPDGTQMLGGVADVDALRLARHSSTSSTAPAKTLWHFPNGWASTSSADDPAPTFGGSGWYWLRAVGEDADGRRREWMLEEVAES